MSDISFESQSSFNNSVILTLSKTLILVMLLSDKLNLKFLIFQNLHILKHLYL